MNDYLDTSFGREAVEGEYAPMAGARTRRQPGPHGGLAAARPRKRKRKLFRLYTPIEPRTYTVVAILSFAALIGGWWLAAELDLAKDIFLPSPADVWDAGLEAAKDGTLWDDARTSIIRITSAS